MLDKPFYNIYIVLKLISVIISKRNDFSVLYCSINNTDNNNFLNFLSDSLLLSLVSSIIRYSQGFKIDFFETLCISIR